MNLFEIDQELQNLIDPESGELLDISKFEELQMAKEDKIKNIALWIINLKSDVEQLKEQKLKFAERQSSAERKIESLKNYLSLFLNGEKRAYPECKISYRATKSVNISELFSDENYMKISYAPNKEKIKEALENGEVIEGASIEEKQSIIIK